MSGHTYIHTYIHTHRTTTVTLVACACAPRVNKWVKVVVKHDSVTCLASTLYALSHQQ